MIIWQNLVPICCRQNNYQQCFPCFLLGFVVFNLGGLLSASIFSYTSVRYSLTHSLSTKSRVEFCALPTQVINAPGFTIDAPYFKPVTLRTVWTHCAALNSYIKAQHASPFHHLFIWANSIVYGESMILYSEEVHSALHPQKPLLALANCIFMKEWGQAILSQTRLLALQGLPWTCNWLWDTVPVTSPFPQPGVWGVSSGELSCGRPGMD